MTTTPITSLAQTAAFGGQQLAQYRLSLIGHQLTAQLNKKIAQLRTASQDTMVPILQSRASALAAQKVPYTTAQAQLSGNSNAVSDMKIQLGNAAFAASLGDSTGFDQALAAAQSDVDILSVVPNLAGFQPDGIANLKINGLGIQSGSTYDLTTPAGQAQAAADIQNAQDAIDQIFTTTTQNQAIANTITQLIDGQISDLNTQVSRRQQTELGDAANQIAKAKQQVQTQFHLAELAFGNIAQSSGILEAAQAPIDPTMAPGTLVSILDTQTSSSTQTIFNTIGQTGSTWA